VKRGELLVVTADSMLPSGAALSRLGERELIFHGLFPGERGTVRVDALSRQKPRAFGSLLKRESTHPARREAACQNHEARTGGACGGCALMELDEHAQREAKRILLAEQFGLVVPEVEGTASALGYRFSSKRVALSCQGTLRLGSYSRASHAPAVMTACLVDHPRLVQAFAEVESAAQKLGIEPYDERSDRGDLRAVWAKTNGAQAIVTLVVREPEGASAKQLHTRLDTADGVLVSVHAASSNSLRGERAELRRGLAELCMELLGQRVELGALGFLQPNPEVAALAYTALLSGANEGAAERRLAYDLYAGAGVTTRLLAKQYAEVVACEAHPESAAALGIAAEDTESFLARALLTPAPRKVDMVIANPPRKGLGPEVVAQLRALGARELRIMSCGPEGLARDLAALTQPNGYTLRSLRAFDTLPQTPHVELVAQLSLTGH
jgi:23S rRNA (uracil1939-C5)-methyltransferase